MESRTRGCVAYRMRMIETFSDVVFLVCVKSNNGEWSVAWLFILGCEKMAFFCLRNSCDVRMLYSPGYSDGMCRLDVDIGRDSSMCVWFINTWCWICSRREFSSSSFFSLQWLNPHIEPDKHTSIFLPNLLIDIANSSIQFFFFSNPSSKGFCPIDRSDSNISLSPPALRQKWS